MTNNKALTVIRSLVFLSLIVLAVLFFLPDTDNDSAPITEDHSQTPTEANPQTDSHKPELTLLESEQSSSDEQTMIHATSPLSSDAPLPEDLGGIDNIPTPEMLEAMQAFAPEAGDDGFIGEPPEAGDDGTPGEPPEAGNDLFLTLPPEGYTIGSDEGISELDGPGMPAQESQ